MQKLVRFAMAATLGLVLGCGDDDKSPTEHDHLGSVSGTVQFEGGWPASGDVQVSIYSTLSPPWVPMGPPDAASDPITTGSTSYTYRFDGLDEATYAAVFVSWRDPANPSNARLLGMYWAYPDSVGIDSSSGLPRTQPTGVEVASGALDVSDVDMTADLGLAP